MRVVARSWRGRRFISVRWLAVLAVAVGAWLVAFPGAAQADMYGPCTVSTVAGGTPMDVTDLVTWHTRSTDQVMLAIAAPFEIRPDSASYALGPPRRYYWLGGFGVSATKGGGPSSPGITAPLDFASERLLGARFNLNWSIEGPQSGDQCSWSTIAVLDDVNPLFTVFGGGALLLAVLAVVAIVVGSRARARWWKRIGLGLLGAAGGIAAASALEQFAVTPWKSGFVLGYGLALIGLVAGLMLVGVARRAKRSPPGLSAA